MKYIFLSLLILALCIFHDRHHQEAAPIQEIYEMPEGTRMVALKLKDSLGTVLLAIPNRYDTFYTWLHSIDCSPCGDEQYRFQPEKLPIEMESGLYRYEYDRIDSVDRYTIGHTMNTREPESDTSITIEQIRQNMKEFYRAYRREITMDSIIRVGDRMFAVIILKQVQHKTLVFDHILAFTKIRNFPLAFEFEARTTATDTLHKDFAERTMKLIRSIRVKEQ